MKTDRLVIYVSCTGTAPVLNREGQLWKKWSTVQMWCVFKKQSWVNLSCFSHLVSVHLSTIGMDMAN